MRGGGVGGRSPGKSIIPSMSACDVTHDKTRSCRASSLSSNGGTWLTSLSERHRSFDPSDELSILHIDGPPMIAGTVTASFTRGAGVWYRDCDGGGAEHGWSLWRLSAGIVLKGLKSGSGVDSSSLRVRSSMRFSTDWPISSASSAASLANTVSCSPGNRPVSAQTATFRIPLNL